MEQNTVGMIDINEDNPERKHSQLRDIWRRLCKNRLAVLGMIILCVLVICAIFADFIAPYHYAAQDYSAMRATPSWEHLMGCDNTGRDIFSRVVYGARTSLVVGFISLAVGGVIGCALGAIAGHFGGGLETAIMGFCDILMAIGGADDNLDQTEVEVSACIAMKNGKKQWNYISSMGIGQRQ